MTEPSPDLPAAYVRSAWWKQYDPDELALIGHPDLVDVPPITAPQAQGDVMVLPWPPQTAPAWRGQEIDAAEVMTMDGIRVTADASHWLLPERLAPDPIRYHPTGKGYTLGTLVVPDAAAARLSHREHADLLIGPGVYVLRQQRAYTGPARVNPRHRPAPGPTTRPATD